jgi:hypothetical protein
MLAGYIALYCADIKNAFPIGGYNLNITCRSDVEDGKDPGGTVISRSLFCGSHSCPCPVLW